MELDRTLRRAAQIMLLAFVLGMGSVVATVSALAFTGVTPTAVNDQPVTDERRLAPAGGRSVEGCDDARPSAVPDAETAAVIAESTSSPAVANGVTRATIEVLGSSTPPVALAVSCVPRPGR